MARKRRRRYDPRDPRAIARWVRAGAMRTVGTISRAELRRGVLCVSQHDIAEYGCPHCGFRSGYTMISGGGSASWQCGGCGKDSVYVAEGIIRSTIGIGLSDGTVFYPKVSRHPRFGIPSHGAPDKQPVEGGEFFRSRGIGLDSCLCFVCGTNDRTGEGVEGHTMLHNIAAFVACRESGERVVAMFQQGAKLDYREYEPDYVQVKIGACDKHLLALQFLHAECGDGRITAERIAGALKVAIPTVE